MREVIPSTTSNGVDGWRPPEASVAPKPIASAALECEAADEDRETAKERLLGVVEQVVAPPNRVTHRLLAQGQITRAAAEQRQSLFQACSSAAGGKTLIRAAASSIASGSPSTRLTMSATAGSVSAVRRKSGLMACARSVKSRTAPDIPASSIRGRGACSGSGATGNSRSPESRSPIRLVIRSVTPGQASRRSRSRGPAVTTCSKLSRTRSRRLSARTSIRRSRSDSVPMSRSPSAPAMVSRTRLGLAIGARLTKATPSGKSSTTSVAAAIARRVLPTPPGPVKVSRRTPGSRSSVTTAASSWSRAIKRVSGRGRGVPPPSTESAISDGREGWRKSGD